MWQRSWIFVNQVLLNWCRRHASMVHLIVVYVLNLWLITYCEMWQSVCVTLHSHSSKITKFCQLSVRVTHGYASVLLRWHCNTLCYVLLVLSCFHIMERMDQNPRCYISSSLTVMALGWGRNQPCPIAFCFPFQWSGIPFQCQKLSTCDILFIQFVYDVQKLHLVNS